MLQGSLLPFYTTTFALRRSSFLVELTPLSLLVYEQRGSTRLSGESALTLQGLKGGSGSASALSEWLFSLIGVAFPLV